MFLGQLGCELGAFFGVVDLCAAIGEMGLLGHMGYVKDISLESKSVYSKCIQCYSQLISRDGLNGLNDP